MAILYGENSCLPFFYKKLSGNIPDVSTVKQLLKDMEFLGCKGIKLALDRGFYSERNINELCGERLKFLMGTKLSVKYIRAELDKHRVTIRNWENFMPDSEVFGLTVPIQWKFKRFRPYKKDEINESRRMYLHFYYDSVRALEDERNFAKLMSKLYSELLSGNRDKSNEAAYEHFFTVKTTPVRGTKVNVKEDAVTDERKSFGYFALIGNETLTASQALTIYRNKDVAEKAFDNVKDRLDMRRLNVSSDLSLDGKLFVVFVALSFTSYLHNAMKRAFLYQKFTMNELLDELELIERFERQGHKPQIGEITKKQLDLYTALNVAPPKTSLC